MHAYKELLYIYELLLFDTSFHMFIFPCRQWTSVPKWISSSRGLACMCLCPISCVAIYLYFSACCFSSQILNFFSCRCYYLSIRCHRCLLYFTFEILNSCFLPFLFFGLNFCWTMIFYWFHFVTASIYAYFDPIAHTRTHTTERKKKQKNPKQTERKSGGQRKTRKSNCLAVMLPERWLSV